jgi:hypothetical protein
MERDTSPRATDAVRSSDLARLLREALERDDDLLSIAGRAEINERLLRRILRGETKTTTIGLADRILVALGRLDALYSGEVGLVVDNRNRNRVASALACDEEGEKRG